MPSRKSSSMKLTSVMTRKAYEERTQEMVAAARLTVMLTRRKHPYDILPPTQSWDIPFAPGERLVIPNLAPHSGPSNFVSPALGSNSEASEAALPLANEVKVAEEAPLTPGPGLSLAETSVVVSPPDVPPEVLKDISTNVDQPDVSPADMTAKNAKTAAGPRSRKRVRSNADTAVDVDVEAPAPKKKKVGVAESKGKLAPTPRLPTRKSLRSRGKAVLTA